MHLIDNVVVVSKVCVKNVPKDRKAYKGGQEAILHHPHKVYAPNKAVRLAQNYALNSEQHSTSFYGISVM